MTMDRGQGPVPSTLALALGEMKLTHLEELHLKNGSTTSTAMMVPINDKDLTALAKLTSLRVLTCLLDKMV